MTQYLKNNRTGRVIKHTDIDFGALPTDTYTTYTDEQNANHELIKLRDEKEVEINYEKYTIDNVRVTISSGTYNFESDENSLNSLLQRTNVIGALASIYPSNNKYNSFRWITADNEVINLTVLDGFKILEAITDLKDLHFRNARNLKDRLDTYNKTSLQALDLSTELNREIVSNSNPNNK